MRRYFLGCDTTGNYDNFDRFYTSRHNAAEVKRRRIYNKYNTIYNPLHTL